MWIFVESIKMEFTIKASSSPRHEGNIEIGEYKVKFGVTKQNNLPTPADLLVSAFAACCLKNIERFSEFMHYKYESADISVKATRKEKPPMMEAISFTIRIITDDRNINTDLLLRNLQKFGTIYNTLNAICAINGEIIAEDK